MQDRIIIEPKRSSKNGFLWFTGLGATGGALLTTWLAPKAIAWYFNPPAQFGFNCVAPIEWALKRLQWAQVVGIVLGSLLGLSLYVILFKRHHHESQEPLPPARG